MIYEKRRPVRGGADQLGGGQKSYLTPSQIATDAVPPIIALHLGLDLVDDGEAWSRSLALAAGAWLQRRRRAK